MRKVLFVVLAGSLAGCSSVQVKPLSASNRIEHVCIERNDKVIVEDFLSVLDQGFKSRGISTQIYDGAAPAGCEYTVNYVAHKAWDMKPYLKDAEIEIRHNGEVVSSGKLHTADGLQPSKWDSTEEKMRPVIDQMFAGLRS